MDAKRVEPFGNTNLVTARKRDAFALRPITERRIVDLDFPAHWQGRRLKPTAPPVNCASRAKTPRGCVPGKTNPIWFFGSFDVTPFASEVYNRFACLKIRVRLAETHVFARLPLIKKRTRFLPSAVCLRCLNMPDYTIIDKRLQALCRGSPVTSRRSVLAWPNDTEIALVKLGYRKGSTFPGVRGNNRIHSSRVAAVRSAVIVQRKAL
jgi:hypothetical protein